jgi:hypothetical protein
MSYDYDQEFVRVETLWICVQIFHFRVDISLTSKICTFVFFSAKLWFNLLKTESAFNSNVIRPSSLTSENHRQVLIEIRSCIAILRFFTKNKSSGYVSQYFLPFISHLIKFLIQNACKPNGKTSIELLPPHLSFHFLPSPSCFQWYPRKSLSPSWQLDLTFYWFPATSGWKICLLQARQHLIPNLIFWQKFRAFCFQLFNKKKCHQHCST